jgi:hypothetical protein
MGVVRLWLTFLQKRDACAHARVHPFISSCRAIQTSDLSASDHRGSGDRDHRRAGAVRPRHTVRLALTLSVAAIGGLLAACVAPSQSIAQTLKAPLSGFVSMGPVTLGPGGVPINDMTPILAEPGVFSGVVINIGWDALQPTQSTLDTSTIDQALAAVSAYNAKYPKTPLGVRLNVEAALLAPGWVKTMDGPAVVTLDQPNGTAPPTIFTIGRFWNMDYQMAWANLQTQLAAKYDTNPLINEISNTACSSVTDEPFVIINSSLAITNMHAAGFTDAKYLACLENSPAYYQGWKETPMHWAFNPFEHSDAGYVVVDETTTQEIIQAFRIIMGPKAILANHDLQSGTLNGTNEAEYPNIALMYQQLKQLGGLINLQSNTAVQDWTDTINYGIASGATDIEFWPGTAPGYLQSSVSQAQLAQWSAQLKANRQAVTAFSSCTGETCTGAGL